MPKLSIVPPSEPSPAEKVRQRIRGMDRPDGILQCPRCGCRASATVTAGSRIVNGRREAGTVIAKDVCDECRKRGIHSPMLPEIKSV